MRLFSNDRTDYNTLIPVMEKHRMAFGEVLEDLICLSIKVQLTDGFSAVNISKNNDLAWDMIHIGQADVNIMECGKVKEVYVY